MLSNATPGGIGPIQNTCTANCVRIPVGCCCSVVSVCALYSQFEGTIGLLLHSNRLLCPGACGSVVSVRPAIAVIKGRCASVVVFNGNDGGAIVVDVDIKAFFAVALEACTGRISRDRRQGSSETNPTVAIEVLVEFGLVLCNATPGGIRPVENP